MIPKWINNLQGNRFMYWGIGKMKFARPIRWLVALIDEKDLDVRLVGTDPEVTSSSLSRGLRFKKTDISIKSANSYQSTMQNVGVIVD